MSILTLTANRSLAPFAEGSYGYAYADHGVRKDGELITPTALTQTVGASGAISFDLVPSDQADDCEQFTYTVAAFDPNGRRIFIANIVMPDTDVSIWSLIPKTVDLDLRGEAAIATVVEAEPEPDVYCGVEPVEPVGDEQQITELVTTNATGASLSNDNLTVTSHGNYGQAVTTAESSKTDGIFYWETVYGVGNSGVGVRPDGKNEAYVGSTANSYGVWKDESWYVQGTNISGHGPYPMGGVIRHLLEVSPTGEGSYRIADGENDFELVGVLPSGLSWQAASSGYASAEVSFRFYEDQFTYDIPNGAVAYGVSLFDDPDQAQVDAYQAAKATYDQCIADGGIPGYDPSAVYCGVEPVDPGVAGTLIVAGAFADGDASGGRYTTRDYDSAVGDNTFTPLTHDIDLSDLTVVFDLVLHTTPSEGNGFQVDGSAPIFRIATTVGSVSNYKRASLHDVESAGSVFDPYPSSGDRYDYIVNKFIDIPLVEGTVLRFGVNQYSTTWGVFDLVDVAQPTLVTQDQVDAYTAAKATYDQCIADGGIPGEQP